jgi:hypothetical protein
MKLRTLRWLAAALAGSAGVVGLWAATAPRAFYDSFPWPGHRWVSALGPYNEHLTRDVGGLYLALLALSTWAAVRPSRDLLRVTGVAWLASGIPHLGFHLGHLAMFDPVDQIEMATSLGATVLAAGALLWSRTGER